MNPDMPDYLAERGGLELLNDGRCGDGGLLHTRLNRGRLKVKLSILKMDDFS